MSQGEAAFEIAVLTAGGKDLDLSRELRQVKAALLYADRVRLVSPTVAILQAFAGIADGSDPELIERLIGLTMPADFPRGKELRDGLHRKPGKQRTPGQIAFDWRMRSVAAAQRGGFQEYARQLRSDRTRPSCTGHATPACWTSTHSTSMASRYSLTARFGTRALRTRTIRRSTPKS
jgi:hypothetical protein